jgi:hypothetical protein
VSQGYFSSCRRARFKTAWAASTRIHLRYRPPVWIGPSFCLLPVESCRGTSPTQAAMSRSDRNAFRSVTTAVIAVANNADSLCRFRRGPSFYSFTVLEGFRWRRCLPRPLVLRAIQPVGPALQTENLATNYPASTHHRMLDLNARAQHAAIGCLRH